MRFKVGDRVKLSKNSDFYGENHQIPLDSYGIIYKIDASSILFYKVIWNGGSNSYSDIDLEPVILNHKLARIIYPNAKPTDCEKYLIIWE